MLDYAADVSVYRSAGVKAGLNTLISCFSNSFPFCHLDCLLISSSSALSEAEYMFYSLSCHSYLPSFLFSELVHLIHMQPSGRNKGGIQVSLHSYGKYQGHVCTVRNSSASCLQLHVALPSCQKEL